MRRYIFSFIILLVFLFILSFPLHTLAHTSETDGFMTVTLHISPNDDPVPGKQAYLNFLFNDATKKFNLSNCACTVFITEQGEKTDISQLAYDKKNKLGVWGTSMSYVFPERNVYKIVLSGRPKSANSFHQFSVTWYFRVDTLHPGIVEDEKGPPDILVLLSALGVVVIGLILFGIFIKREFTP